MAILQTEIFKIFLCILKKKLEKETVEIFTKLNFMTKGRRFFKI